MRFIIRDIKPHNLLKSLDASRLITYATDRARGFNNKGILNEYRKPKASYFAVQEKYSKL